MISPENKSRIIEWLSRGKKTAAIRFVCDTYQVSPAVGTQMVNEIEEEQFPGQKSSGPDPVRIVSRVFAGVGFIFLMIIIFLFWSDHKTVSNSSSVKGTVTSLDYNNSGGAAPVIGYRFNGKKMYFRGSVWSSPPSFAVGEEVELLVNNNNPQDVIINSFFERYFLMGLLGLLGFIFGGIGVGLMIFMKN